MVVLVEGVVGVEDVDEVAVFKGVIEWDSLNEGNRGG